MSVTPSIKQQVEADVTNIYDAERPDCTTHDSALGCADIISIIHFIIAGTIGRQLIY